MFDLLRKKLGPIVVAMIVGLICFVFIFYGVNTSRNRGGLNSGGVAAEVDGEKVTIGEFMEGYQNQMAIYRNMSGGMVDDPVLDLKIRQSVLDRLIQRKLVLIAAEKMGMRVSDEELRNKIVNIPYFRNRKTNEFDPELYKKIVTYRNRSVVHFEEQQRKDILVEKAVQFIKNSVIVTDGELLDYYRIDGEKRNISYVRIDRNVAKKYLKITGKEIDTFLKDEKNLKRVQDLYKTKPEYNRKEEACVRQILIEEKAGKPSTDPFELRKKLTRSNWNKLARKYSDDPLVREKKGDIGCFNRDQIDKEIADAVFTVKKGGITQPVKLQTGYHIFYKYDTKPAKTVPFEKVKKELAREMVADTKVDEIDKFCDDLSKKIKKSFHSKGALNALLARYSLKVKKTDMFSRVQGYVPGIGQIQQMISDAFSDKKPIYRKPAVYKNLGSYFVAEVVAQESPDMKEFEKNRERILSDLRYKKENSFIQLWMKEISKKARVKKNELLLAVRKDE